jgi:penicillin-binding protein 2
MLVFDQMKKSDQPLWWLAAVVSAGMLVLLGGLWYRQVYASSQYVESLKTQSIRQVRYPALRGKILDRQGRALAVNRPSYNINLYLEELSGLFQDAYRKTKAQQDQIKSQAAVASGLAAKTSWYQRLWRKSSGAKSRWTSEEIQALGKQVRFSVASNLVFQLGVRMGQQLVLDEKKFNDHYANRLVVPLPVMEDLNSGQVAVFHELASKMPGMYLDIQPLREYPRKTVAAHLMGYLVHSDKVAADSESEMDLEDSLPGLPDYEGSVGLEGKFDDDLRGRSGVKAVQVNNLGYRQSETILLAAEPGSNIVTTIDLNIQMAAEQAIRQSGNIAKGAVVVMDPRNGDILAMVSYPPFDPNAFIPRMPSDTWARLNDPETKTMLNRATYGEYMPGSIFKIIVGLACLESGRTDPNAILKTKGYFQANAKSKPIKDTAAPGNYDFCKALAHSSNEYFIEEGLKTGLWPIVRMAERVFLGKKTGVPLGGQEVDGFLPTEEWVKKIKERGNPWREGDLHNFCIGQGYITVTPIQMAVMTSAMANGGKVLWPRLVERIEQQTTAAEMGVRTYPAFQVRGELNVTSGHLEIVRQAMLADVDEEGSTGVSAAVAGLKIAGKTGTAEVGPRENRRKNTWFVSFAPFENPRYVVVVLAESGGASGGRTCAPVARSIYKAILDLEAKG